MIIRIFHVFNKVSCRWAQVNGIESLAKFVGCTVEEIPSINLYKVTIGNFSIIERVEKEQFNDNQNLR